MKIKKISIKNLSSHPYFHCLKKGKEKIQVNSISNHASYVNKKTIFVAIKGYKTDGHNYIGQAIENGTRVIICEKGCIQNTKFLEHNDVWYLSVDNTRKAFSLLASIIYGCPADQLTTIGITGTKGKSTVANICYQLLNKAYTNCICLFSTSGNYIGKRFYKAVRTTPEAKQIQQMLHTGVKKGCSHGIIEVSSHALSLHRVSDINWDYAVFTSFSREHLNFHKDMESYFQAKMKIFHDLGKGSKPFQLAVINGDDKTSDRIKKLCCEYKNIKVLTYGLSAHNDIYPENIKMSIHGMNFVLNVKNKIKQTISEKIKIDKNTNNNPLKRQIIQKNLNKTLTVLDSNPCINIRSKILGRINALNMTAAILIALLEGVNPKTIESCMNRLAGIKGRFEIVQKQPVLIIVDYAHSPDSLEKILRESRTLLNNSCLILVFGCAGERDRGNRPLMGEIAARLADYSIITTDDSYQEEPVIIMNEIKAGFETGIKNGNSGHFILIEDRKAAILHGLQKARTNDILLIAGKGHEDVQQQKNGPVPFNDRKVVLELLKNLK